MNITREMPARIVLQTISIRAISLEPELEIEAMRARARNGEYVADTLFD